MEKYSYIKQLPNGLWRVYSEKGKNLGTCKTKEQAEKRLKQVEYFKHKKASTNLSYSQVVRELNKEDKEKAIEFIKKFKPVFDEAFVNNIEDPAETAFMQVMQETDAIDNIAKEAEINPKLIKTAQYLLNPYSPEESGKIIAKIIEFLTKRISMEKRPYSIMNLKKKIKDLDEIEMANKKTPSTASLGQSITFIKTILNGRDSNFIRATLNNIIKFLH